MRQANFGQRRARFASSAWRRRAIFLGMAALGATLLATGLEPFNTANVAIGIADLVLAITLLLIEPIAWRGPAKD
jgi:hypothetical protein